MPQSTQCPKCRVVLNLPEGVEGRRLKCPSCGERFLYGGTAAIDEPKPTASGRPGSGGDSRSPASTLLLTQGNEVPLPIGDKDLRETFGPDLLRDDDAPPKAKSSGSGAGPPVADVAGLLADEGGVPRKRRVPAEGRSQARRCPNCGAVVPVGMSLCRCGLDLDTGKRQILDEILEEAPPAPSGPSIPLTIAIPGGVVALISVILTIAALLKSLETGGPSLGPISQQQGFLSLAVVGGFAIYAAVQFLRLKSFKMLIVALMLGGLIDLVALIVMPIVDALDVDQSVVSAPVADEDAPGHIKSATESIDQRKLYYGIAILLADVGLMIFLLTPQVRRPFERSRVGPGVPIG